MSRKPSFANPRGVAAPEPAAGEGGLPRGPASREGRKQIAGFFTPDMSLAMHMLARRQGRSLQALMTEAFDDVLREWRESGGI